MWYKNLTKSLGDVMKKECKCTRSKHRTDEEKRDLTRRLKIIAGQINGIQQMISEDRYCDDVLFHIRLLAV